MNNLCQNCQKNNLKFRYELDKIGSRYFCSSYCCIEYCKKMDWKKQGKVIIMYKEQEKKQ